MLTISELYVYPIKSLGGVSVPSAPVTSRGLQYDRRWLLVDENNIFLTQREINKLALLQVHLKEQGLLITHKLKTDSHFIPFEPQTSEYFNVTIWDDVCQAQAVSKESDKWFSDMLSFNCRLVYMPDTTERFVDTKYANNNEITGFADGYPMLILGQTTLDDLNDRLEEKLPVDRFRPNIVFTGGQPFEEDLLEHFVVKSIDMFAVKPCARCVITTINQTTAETGKEPLRTLSKYRMANNKIYFAQNLLHKGEGIIHVGDTLEIKKKRMQSVFQQLQNVQV